MKGDEASLKELTGAAANGYAPGLEHAHSQRGRVERIAKLVREVPQPLGALVVNQPGVLGHCTSDGIVEAQIEGLKFFRGDAGVTRSSFA